MTASGDKSTFGSRQWSSLCVGHEPFYPGSVSGMDFHFPRIFAFYTGWLSGPEVALAHTRMHELARSSHVETALG